MLDTTITVCVVKQYITNITAIVYCHIDGLFAESYMQFIVTSTSSLILSFNVSNGPPTYVSCTVNGNGISIDELSRVIVNGPAFVTKVTVTLRSREAGNYQCTVSNQRVSAGNISGIVALNSTSASK